jgi:hypothetical protein
MIRAEVGFLIYKLVLLVKLIVEVHLVEYLYELRVAQVVLNLF